MRARLAMAFLVLGGCIGFDSPKPSDDTGAQGVLQASPSEVAFGEVVIGEKEIATLSVSNTGSSGVRLLSASLDGMGGAVTYTSTLVLPADVGPGDAAVYSLEFVPTSAIYYSGTFQLVTEESGAESTFDVALSGAGVRDSDPDDTGDDTGDTPGSLDFSPSTVAFGKVDIGRTNTESLTVQNVGSSSILIASIVAGDTTLDVDPSFALPYVLNPGVPKQVDVLYTPRVEGMLSSWIEFQTDDAENPNVRVSVTGQAADICDLCAPDLWVSTGGKDPHTLMGFYYSLAWAIPAVLTVTLTNEGDMDLDITDVHVNNDSLFPAGTFTVGWSPGRPVAPWSSTSFTVTFTATAQGYEIPNSFVDENYIHIASNDPYEPDFAIALWAIAGP